MCLRRGSTLETVRDKHVIKSMNLKQKFAVGFGVLLLILLVTGSSSYWTTSKLVNSAEGAQGALEKKEFSTGIELLVRQQLQATNDYVFTKDQDALARSREFERQLNSNLDKLKPMMTGDKAEAIFARIQQSSAAMDSLMNEEVRLDQAGKKSEARRLAFGDKEEQTDNDLTSALNDLENMESQLVHSKEDTLHSSEALSDKLIALLCIAGLSIGVATAIFMSKSIGASIARMLDLVNELAANNVGAADMEITSQDEIGQAGMALNQMKNNLRELIQTIAGTAEHVASASEEISSSASQQAQGAETQRDQTAQVATAMQEMSSTVLQVSENSSKAAEASRKAAETARQGGTVVDETLTKMRAIAESVGATAKKVEELGKSSDQIGRIIGVIDDIADQTNLLALNAAIEAARAGEQGRGFAVVADEVRKLAERTTSATKEIAQMIRTVQQETKTAVSAMEQGTKQVEEGVQTTAQAGDSLKQIIHTSEEVGEMITHIATAATEQSSATEEINSNIEQIARLVKESADGAQQSAKACQDLSGLALDLQKMVSNFRLEGNGLHTPKKRYTAPVSREEKTKAFAAGAS
jgi:methyl-accepting chemotaxis protein